MTSSDALAPRRMPFQRLYRWILGLAESRYALPALAIVAFTESSFFPLPPDLLLIPMTVAQPRKAWVYAAVCTVASVAGGLLGYAIGAWLFDTLGQWLIGLYGYATQFEAVQAAYDRWGWLFILVKGLTPIPFKLVTILSGVMHYNLPLFVALCLVTRGARFFIEAGLLTRFGAPIRSILDRHFGLFLLASLAVVIVGFWVATRVF